MVTGELKNAVDRIWQKLWEGGVVNPLTVIEQLTYLIFIRSLDQKELENEKMQTLGSEISSWIFPQSNEGQKMRWSKFTHLGAIEMFDIVANQAFPFIKQLSGDDTPFAIFMKDATFSIPTAQKLEQVVTGINEMYALESMKNRDIQGDMYEYMLGKLATSGKNGQFRTPQHIREMMVELVCPKPGDRIADPACGTAGFLVSASEYIHAHYSDSMDPSAWQFYSKEMFTGFEIDQTMLRISAMNLMLHSINNPTILYKDSLSKKNEIANKFNVILANPPFKGSVEKEQISENLKAISNTSKTELLFVSLFIRMLAIGGRCACIVPDGVLFSTSKAHKDLREELIENQNLQAIISLPSGVFKPYAGVSTAIMLFTKTNAGGTEKVWFYDMQADGYSLDDKRNPIANSDIPDIVSRFHNLANETARERTEQSFFVSRKELEDNGYDLSVNKYKKVEYEVVEYPSTREILIDLNELERKIKKKLKEMGELIK